MKYFMNIKEAASLLIMVGEIKPCELDKDLNQFAIHSQARNNLDNCLGLDGLGAEIQAEKLF